VGVAAYAASGPCVVSEAGDVKGKRREPTQLMVVPYDLWAQAFHAVGKLKRDEKDGYDGPLGVLERRMHAYTRAFVEGRT
jgi:hypothetical protein